MSFIHVQALALTLLCLPVLSHKSDDNDVYFEVTDPPDIRYTFRSRMARDIGADFKQLLKDIYLIPVKPLGGCSGVQNRLELKGNIALMERGQCSFVTKIVNAQESGALGVLIMDNDRSADDRFVDMIDDSTKRTVQIPAMFLQYRDGHLILDAIEKNHLIGARINIPLNLTYNEILQVHRAPGSYWL